MYRRWRRRKKPKPGIHGRPPFPCAVDCRESEPAVKGSLRRAKLRRALDHRLRFPRKITEKRERGLWDIRFTAVLPRNDLSAIHRPFLACEGLHDGASLPDVPLKLFRGRPVQLHSNSIFVDGVMLFPQMDVWSR